MRVANDSQRQQQKEEELAERKQVEKAEIAQGRGDVVHSRN